jgi:hypothetical protein
MEDQKNNYACPIDSTETHTCILLETPDEIEQEYLVLYIPDNHVEYRQNYKVTGIPFDRKRSGYMFDVETVMKPGTMMVTVNESGVDKYQMVINNRILIKKIVDLCGKQTISFLKNRLRDRQITNVIEDGDK